MPKRNKDRSQQLLEPLERLAAESLRDLGDGEEASHTPIIITGGSARIELSSEEYSPVAGIYISSDLHLHLIECLHATHADGTGLCYFVRPGEVCTVVFHCTRAGLPEENLIIRGGLTTAPTVIFDFNEYAVDTTAPATRNVHSNANRKIVAMEIFRTRGGLTDRVHVCPLIPDSGRCQYRIWDTHS